MTTESLMVHELKRGLFIANFHELSIGIILDYINQYDHLHNTAESEEENIRKASQIEFNIF